MQRRYEASNIEIYDNEDNGETEIQIIIESDFSVKSLRFHLSDSLYLAFADDYSVVLLNKRKGRPSKFRLTETGKHKLAALEYNSNQLISYISYYSDKISEDWLKATQEEMSQYRIDTQAVFFSAKSLNISDFWATFAQAIMQWFHTDIWWLKKKNTKTILKSPLHGRELKKRADKDYSFNHNYMSFYLDTETLKDENRYVAKLLLDIEALVFLQDEDCNDGSQFSNEFSVSSQYELYIVKVNTKLSPRLAFNFISLLGSVSKNFYDAYIQKNQLANRVSADTELTAIAVSMQDNFINLLGQHVVSNNIPDFKFFCDEVIEEYPFTVCLILYNEETDSFRYAFTPEQRNQLKSQFKSSFPNSFDSDLSTQKIPEKLPKKLTSTGFPIIEEKGGFKFGKLACDHFYPQDSVEQIQFIPIFSDIHNDFNGLTAIIQFTWLTEYSTTDDDDLETEPPLKLPLFSDICSAVRDAVRFIKGPLIQNVETYRFAKKFKKFELTSRIAKFISHNIPKTTVTPLLKLADQLRDEPNGADIQRQIASQLYAIASHLDMHLNAMDIFRLPRSNKYQLVDFQLQEVILLVQDIFEILKRQKCYTFTKLSEYRDSIRLSVINNCKDYVIRGYKPLIFHAVYVAVDNALRFLNASILNDSLERGLIKINVGLTDENEIAIKISDKAIGMSTEYLNSLQQKIAYAENSARQSKPLQFAQTSDNSVGENLGVGLLLAAYFLALLDDGKGNYGTLRISSVINEGTEVLIILPDNSQQQSIQL